MSEQPDKYPREGEYLISIETKHNGQMYASRRRVSRQESESAWDVPGRISDQVEKMIYAMGIARPSFATKPDFSVNYGAP